VFDIGVRTASWDNQSELYNANAGFANELPCFRRKTILSI
jgi:hypothetical protein